MTDAWLHVRGLRRSFPVRVPGLWGQRQRIHVVDGVDLDVHRGECLGIVGESGSGKTTLGRCLVRLLQPTGGSLHLGGQDLLALKGRELRAARRRFQMVFQDPFGSLNPRLRVSSAVEEPLIVHRIVPRDQVQARVDELLELVGLHARLGQRYPHELSGGQRQRVGLCRALAAAPELVVADEPVSSLDVSVQAQILGLMEHLTEHLQLSLVFISHDLAVVESLAHRVAVFYLGRVVELAPARRLFSQPLHPYTAALLSSTPRLAFASRRRPSGIAGEVASFRHPPAGCRFHPRCPKAKEQCRSEDPVLTALDGLHSVACHFPGVNKQKH